MSKYKTFKNKLILSSASLAFMCSCDDSCVVKGTKVLTPNGPRPIENLKVGDIVTTYSHKQLKEAAVTRIYTGMSPVTYKISAQGNILEASPSHPIKTDQGWVQASELTMKHKIHLQEHTLTKIDQIIPIYKVSAEKVYNIEVKPYHNFFANNILTHNKSVPYPPPVCPYVDSVYGPVKHIEFNDNVSPQEIPISVADECIGDDLSFEIVDYAYSNTNTQTAFSISEFQEDGSIILLFNPSQPGVYRAALEIKNQTETSFIAISGTLPSPAELP